MCACVLVAVALDGRSERTSHHSPKLHPLYSTRSQLKRFAQDATNKIASPKSVIRQREIPESRRAASQQSVSNVLLIVCIQDVNSYIFFVKLIWCSSMKRALLSSVICLRSSAKQLYLSTQLYCLSSAKRFSKLLIYDQEQEYESESEMKIAAGWP